MINHHPLILNLWREACRQIHLRDSFARMVGMLRDSLPVEEARIFCMDASRNGVTLLGSIPATIEESAYIAIGSEQMKRLDHWCQHATPVRFEPGSPPQGLPAELTDRLSSHVMAVPLYTEHGTAGVVVLVADKGRSFSEDDESLAGLIREPMSAALENDRRLVELESLREAAEADKRKLLHRLGRESLSDEIIGAEGGLRLVMERVGLMARSEVPVLILGETGSGKEMIARAIHDRSSRSAGPFIRVNCGAIPPELIDSELFGHERGSFTGATATRKGWFERAHEGTLFLDEIGELPAAAQVRLLRVLQEGVFERVGGEHPVHVHVRTVTATNRDLARMVQDHRFREDLWYRVAVFPIVLPPLRERIEDIPALAAHFARRAALRFGLRLQLPETEHLALLASYDWPGNVRELASVLDRAAILGDGESLEVAKALGITPSARPAVLPRAQQHVATDTPIESLDEVLRQHIERGLAITRGKIEGPGGVAEMLRINPHTLRARMRKLGVDRKDFMR